MGHARPGISVYPQHEPGGHAPFARGTVLTSPQRIAPTAANAANAANAA